MWKSMKISGKRFWLEAKILNKSRERRRCTCQGANHERGDVSGSLTTTHRMVNRVLWLGMKAFYLLIKKHKSKKSMMCIIRYAEL